MIKLSQIFFAAIFIYSTSQSIAAANFTGLPWDSLTNFDAWGATNTSTWHAGASSSWSSPGSDLSCPCPQDKRWKVKAACIDVLLPCLHQMFVWLPRISQDHNQWTNEPSGWPTVKKTCKRVQHLKIANDFMTHGNGSKPITTILGPALGESKSTSYFRAPRVGLWLRAKSQGCVLSDMCEKTLEWICATHGGPHRPSGLYFAMLLCDDDAHLHGWLRLQKTVFGTWKIDSGGPNSNGYRLQRLQLLFGIGINRYKCISMSHLLN